MNKDLKVIKKKFGEKMSHLCRSLFSTLLESEGLLSKLLLDNFNESHYLYDDIVDNRLEEEFKNFIYSLVDVENNNEIIVVKTPEELMEKAGYILYECKSEEDIKKFKKYYAKGEELCTFNGGRLYSCYVFFAVKKNVDEINRVDFLEPSRQDEYGTSVISIQFTRDESHTLSIKNRYNHKVNNPDATFSNNLENIIPGLTSSFEMYYGMMQKNKNRNFELPGYVRANDGKFYKCNYEINNICYCTDNIILDNFEVKKLDKSRYLLIDYFILDLVDKKIKLYNKQIYDSFVDCFWSIDKIDIKNVSDGKIIEIVSTDNRRMELYVSVFNEIKKLYSEDIIRAGTWFLFYNNTLTDINLPNLKYIDSNFLCYCNSLSCLNLPSVVEIQDDFLYHNDELVELNLPSLRSVGFGFLSCNELLKKLVVPKLEMIGRNFLYYNRSLEEIDAPNLRHIEDGFLESHLENATIRRKINNNYVRYLKKYGL